MVSTQEQETLQWGLLNCARLSTLTLLVMSPGTKILWPVGRCLSFLPSVSDHRLEPKSHANCEAERRYIHTYSPSEQQAVICARLRVTATALLASTGSAMRVRASDRASERRRNRSTKRARPASACASSRFLGGNVKLADQDICLIPRKQWPLKKTQFGPSPRISENLPLYSHKPAIT